MDSCSPQTINYLIVQICKAHRARTGELLAEFGVHVGQEMILVALWQTPSLTLTQLAERLGVQPPTVTRMVRRMEKSGLLERNICPTDARVSFVRATPQGNALKTNIETVWQTLEEEVTANLTDLERALFRRILAQVRDNLSSQA
ncbi:MarR family transcriptional regulator [soil metagenome]